MSVYAQNDRWSEVDIGGYHAFILSKHVTFDEESAEAEPDETETAEDGDAEEGTSETADAGATP